MKGHDVPVVKVIGREVSPSPEPAFALEREKGKEEGSQGDKCEREDNDIETRMKREGGERTRKIGQAEAEAVTVPLPTHLALEVADVASEGGEVGVGGVEDEGEGGGCVGHISMGAIAQVPAPGGRKGRREGFAEAAESEGQRGVW